MKLTESVIQFFEEQGCVALSTIDKYGFPHSACKGIVKIEPDGLIYILDLYRGRTFQNLKRHSHVCITAFDEHKFRGYCLKGKAKMMPDGKLQSQILKAWEDRVTSRLTRRLLKNIHEEKGHSGHPELLLPKPEYLIVMDVEEIVDLAPPRLK